MAKTAVERRQQRKARIRSRVNGSAQKPRLTIFRSNMAVYAQLIDDENGVTLASASSMKSKKRGVAGATEVGKALAASAKTKKIENVVFDRNGYAYLGAVKALADAAREAGLHF